MVFPGSSPKPFSRSAWALLRPAESRRVEVIREGRFDAVILTGYFYCTAWIALAAADGRALPSAGDGFAWIEKLESAISVENQV